MSAENHTPVSGEVQGASVLKRIASSGAANTGAALLGSVANFLLIVAVTRLWPVAEAGVLFAAVSVFNIALALSHLGADQGMVRFLAWNSSRLGGGIGRRIMKAGMLPALGMAVLVTAATLLFSQPLVNLLGAPAVSEGRTFIWVIMGFLPIAVLYEQFLAVCRGYAVMRPTIVVERALRPALQVILILAVGLGHGSVVLLAAAWALPYLLCLVLAGYFLRGVLRESPVSSDSGPGEVSDISREFWKFTAPRGLARLAQVMIQRADVIVVTVLLGPAPAAIYTAATRFLVLGQVATSALQQVSEPQLAKLLAEKKMSAVAVVTRQMTLWSVVFVWPIYLLIAVHAPTLLSWVFGTEYQQGASVLVVLGMAMLVSIAIGPMDVLLLMAGRSSLSLLNVSVALVLDLVLCFALIPQWGIFGAGVAWAVAIVVKNAMCTWQVHKHLGLGLSLRFLKVWLVSLVGIFGIAGVLAYLLPGQPWVAIGISFLTGVFYLLFVWRKRSVLMDGTPLKMRG